MEVKEKLQKVFRNVFDNESIELFDEMTANDLEEWDSLMHIQLLIAIEKEFSVYFKTEEVMETANVGQFIGLLNRKLNKNEKK